MSQSFVYMLRCGDGTLYTGWTTDLGARVTAHNAGKGAKYTRSRRPVALVYQESFADRGEARKRECAIKRMTRREKLELVGGQQDETKNKTTTEEKE